MSAVNNNVEISQNNAGATMNQPSPSSQSDLITLANLLKRIPKIGKKLPHIATGLRQAYLRKGEMPTGLGWAFERATAKNPDGYAVYYEDQKYTYRELNARANQIAHYFLSIGAKKGDVIAVMIENRPELLATVIGLAKIGVVSALVNTSQTGKVLTHSVNLVKPIAIIAGDEILQSIEEIRDDLEIPVNRFFWFADQDTRQNTDEAPKNHQNLAQLINDFSKSNPHNTQQVYGNDGLFYIYTSGTTGLPKAVIFKHSRWMLAYGTYGHVLHLNKNDVMYATLPLYHATGLVVCWCGVIAGQSTIAIRRKFSKSEFWKDVEKFNVSAFGYVGELCRYLMDAPPSAQDRQHRVTKMIGNGMRPNIWCDFKKRFGVDEVLELYGSSEGNVGFTNLLNFDNTVGFSPIPYAIIAFDKENNQPIRDSKGFCKKVKKGESGLLIGKITDRTPFDGYTDAEKNKAAILENVFEKGDKYFNTGDLIRDLGFRHAQFVDRLGDTFRWKGENVSTTEVENILCDCEKISEAVVYGVEIPNTNGRAGMASLTAIENQNFEEQDFSTFAEEFKKHLPAYAVPLFLRIQKQMETTGTFKYSKNKLKEENFNPKASDEAIYVLLPNESKYILMTDDIYQNIQKGQYRF